MQFDNRKDRILMFIGDSLDFSNLTVEEGDEVTLYHETNLVMALITSEKDNQFEGIITRSAYDPDLHPSLTLGKNILFGEENIFGVSKRK